LILVDDGSPDNCGAICDEYAAKDSRIHVIHQENGGLSAARNAGIDWVFANSDSQWLTFVDSDDWIHPEMLEQLLDAVIENQVSISICNYVDTYGEEPMVSLKSNEWKLWSTEKLYVQRRVNAVIACAKLYHKQCFQNIRYPVGKIHEDEFVTYRIIFEEKQIPMTETPLYFYFHHPDSITCSEWTPKRMIALKALEEQILYFRKHGYKYAYKWIVLDYAAKIDMYYQLLEQAKISSEEKKKHQRYLKKCRRIAAWNYKDIFVRYDRDIYAKAFPMLMKLYSRVKRLWKRRGENISNPDNTNM